MGSFQAVSASKAFDTPTTTKSDANQCAPRPCFEDLPLRRGDPIASAWGLWGEDDELGTLNLLTPETISQAAKEIKTGQVVPLNLPLNSPLIPMNPRRAPCHHNIIAKGYANDDELHLNTQSSTQWDGLRHYPYQIEQQKRYYNGASDADISGPDRNAKIGIQSKQPSFPDQTS